MITLKTVTKTLAAGALSAAFVMGAMSISAPTAEAGIPQILCGPTLQWSCVGRGGPSYLFIGTVCEKDAYEKAKRRTCKPLVIK